MTESEWLFRQCEADAVDWCRELVHIDSQNPPGRELACADYCRNILEELGMETVLDEFEPNRANVTAFYGKRDSIGLVFNGHLDVVPANGKWRYAPFEARIEEDRLWGRGSADMKAGCAAVMAAVKYCLKSGMDFSEKGVAVLFVADEESTNKGCKRLMKTLKLTGDACIVAEPTKLEVNYGNRGFASFYIRTTGKACHACEPHNGENAIYKMAEVIRRISEFAEEIALRKDPQLGSMSMSVGMIEGGNSLNMVPDWCEIQVEARVFPGYDAQSLAGELEGILKGIGEVTVRSSLPASLVAVESEIVQRAAASIRTVLKKEPVITKFPACSEASFFSVGYRIPTILLGPGDINKAHKANEYVPLKDIKNAVGIYVQMINSYCNRI